MGRVLDLTGRCGAGRWFVPAMEPTAWAGYWLDLAWQIQTYKDELQWSRPHGPGAGARELR
jgi:hypothetical protein